MVPFRSIFFLFPALALFLAGCPKTSTVTPEEEAAAGEETPGEETAAPSEQEPALEVGSDYAGAPSLPAIRFGYTSADLSTEARNILKKNAALLKAVRKAAPGVQIRTEGHCDERGTLEYNLALGQRRANIVRDYYVTIGIPRSAIKTVSYGEERPVCNDSTENCWAQNRRGETTLKSDQPVRIPLSELPAE
jgi:peptidoglycan-associated lipoprotein